MAESEVEETGESEPVVEEEKLPPYMRDEPPTGKTNFVKWALLHGKTEDELKADPNVNNRTIDICAQELEKEGLRTRPPKGEKPTKQIATTDRSQKEIQYFAKGSPPEALIEALTVPISDGEAPIFEKGMKFGMTVLTLGVRVAQELSNMGTQQARPLIEMARDMRLGEAAAAKSAAGEAAMMAAMTVQQSMSPVLSQLAEQVKTSGPDPVKAMMVRTMEPIMQKLMAGIIPGMGPQQPEGWTKKTE